tara:strand:- start:578 stop:1543 length:966 start_codon:yes stop_codon:yes gene_type:complete
LKDNLKKIVIEDFESSCGKKLQNLQLSYQFFGRRLGTAPIILINHALTGNSVVSGEDGWWSEIVGINKAIDLNKFTLLCINIPGNGFNEENFNFSVELNLGDIAHIFIKALNKLKISKLYAIIGGSIGGCLTWEMAAIKNDIAEKIIPVASDWKANDWLIANTYLQDRILENSKDPIGDARIHAMSFYRTPESLNQRFLRSKNIEKGIYNVESWLDHHAIKLSQRFSLNSYKFLNKLLRSADITRDDSILESKILRSKSEIHIISVDSDIFFLPDEDRMTTQRLKKQKVKIKNHVIESIHGHDAFLIETKQISDIFTKILK